MKISEEKGWIVGFNFTSTNGVLEINAEFPRLEYDGGSMSMRTGCVENTFPYNVNVPNLLDLGSFPGRKVKVTVELIDEDEK